MRISLGLEGGFVQFAKLCKTVRASKDGGGCEGTVRYEWVCSLGMEDLLENGCT